MNPVIHDLEKEIERLKEEKSEREAALPAHSIRPHQLQAIEDLEEQIDKRMKELKELLITAKTI